MEGRGKGIGRRDTTVVLKKHLSIYLSIYLSAKAEDIQRCIVLDVQST